mmetsp:Transcript_58531/g.139248  ORF Transcript_58531/g.139248 Transcript_58531/m.139248 type:complete len:81 (+) Transcript_58531:67-309(+)
MAFQILFGPAGLQFMKMDASLSKATGVTQKMTFGHGADHANGTIDKDWYPYTLTPKANPGGHCALNSCTLCPNSRPEPKP